MLRLGALALSSALLLAGCLTASQEPLTDAGADAVDPAGLPLDAFVAHTASGALQPVPAAWADLRIRLAESGPTAEPTIGVASDGTIFTVAYGQGVESLLVRSRDHGQTWEPAGGPLEAPATLDPWIWLDPWTDRIYNTHLYVACTWATWSDDGGDSWMVNPILGCGIPAHDHQKLAGGPPPAGTLTIGYPNVLYYAYNSFLVLGTPVRLGTVVTTSFDGGHTWTPGVQAHEADCHGGVVGPPAVAPDGTVYLGKASCDGVDVVVSRDAGLTWATVVSLNDHGIMPAIAMDPDIAIDDDGTAYVMWTGSDGLPYLSVGTDAGRAWSTPQRVSPPGITATTYTVAAVGDPGRVAVGYVGTSADTSEWETFDPSEAPEDTVWHAYMAFTDDAAAEDPVWVTQRLNPEDDPVQVGCIWLRGGGEPCRNLLDFIDMVERDGRVYMVYTDGCRACETAENSRERDGVVAIVEAGPAMRGGMDVRLEPLVEA